MFYDAIENKHGLKRDPLKALVAPRPIGWISTLSTSGVVNLAPYSFFNLVADKPAFVMFSAGGAKDSARNAAETGEFVCSMATWGLRQEMNATAAAVGPEVSEFALAKLTQAPSRLVKPPRVKESPAALECRFLRTVELPAHPELKKVHTIVFGQVVGIHIDDAFIKDGMVDTAAMRPIARMGYFDYAVVTPETAFTMASPELESWARAKK